MLGSSFVRGIGRRGRDFVFFVQREAIRAVPAARGNETLVLKIDALGDLFLWFSSGILAASLAGREDGRRSVIMVRKELAGFIEGLGLFDEVWGLDTARFRHNFFYRAQTLWRVRRCGFSEVLQLRIAREFLQEDAIVRCAAAAVVRGVVGDRYNLTPAEAAISDHWYRPLVRIGEGTQFEWRRNAYVAQALSGAPPQRFELDLSRTLRPEGLCTDYFVVAPGAGWLPRQWPVERFAELAARVRQRTGLQCVVTGTDAEAAFGEAIAKTTGGLNLCGQLTLLQLARLVQEARLVIANESGLAHIAAYFSVPAAVVMGGGHFGWFMPYQEGEAALRAPVTVYHRMDCFGCNWLCRFEHAPDAPVPCIAAVEADTMWTAVEKILAAL